MKKGAALTNFIGQNEIEQRIFLIRRHKVMLDRDLAELYGVETKYLNRQVKRNKERFPDEFMFQLNALEKEELVPKSHRFQSMKHASVLPHVFIEYGVIMLASVLNSDRAVKMSIYIVKTFVKLREILSTNRELAHKLAQLEQRIDKHDQAIRSIFEALRHLTVPNPDYRKTKIGFIIDS